MEWFFLQWEELGSKLWWYLLSGLPRLCQSFSWRRLWRCSTYDNNTSFVLATVPIQETIPSIFPCFFLVWRRKTSWLPSLSIFLHWWSYLHFPCFSFLPPSPGRDRWVGSSNSQASRREDRFLSPFRWGCSNPPFLLRWYPSDINIFLFYRLHKPR